MESVLRITKTYDGKIETLQHLKYKLGSNFQVKKLKMKELNAVILELIKQEQQQK